MDTRIYTERKIVVGTLIGGGLASAYYFWRTFRALGKPGQAIAAVWAALVVLAFSIVASFIPALDRLPSIVFWGAQIGLCYGVTRGYLATPIAAHQSAGKPEYGWGNTILVAIICMTVTLAPLVGIFYSQGGFSGQSAKYYGRLQHEIDYDAANISVPEVDRIAGALTSAGFFDDELQKTIDVAKDGDRFVVTIYCNESARNPTFIEAVKGLRSDVQRSFPANPIVMDLVIGTPENRITRIE